MQSKDANAVSRKLNLFTIETPGDRSISNSPPLGFLF